MLNWSRYNYLLKREGEFMIYNSLSNSFAAVTESLWKELVKYEVGKPISDLPEELISALKRMRAVVTSDDTERMKIKYQTQRLRFQTAQLSLTICPTLGCNFRCGYCFEHDHPDVDMSNETEERLIEFVKSHTEAKRIGVTWFGGEPLLQFGRIKSLTRKLLEIGKPYGAVIITNGYLLSEKIAKQLPELQINNIQITLDGLAETHDKRRFLKNGGGTYDRIIENICVAAEIIPEVRISIRVNIDKNNADDYVKFFEFVRTKDWKNVIVYPAFVGDYSEGNCGFVLNSTVRRDLLEYYAHKTGERSSHFYPTSNRRECAIRNPNTYVIGPEGEIYKCWNDVGDSKRIVADIYGNVKNEKLLLDYLCGADPLEDPKCNSCILLPVCSGGCPYERLRGTPEEDLCPLIKWNLDDFLWRKYQEHKKTTEKQ
ncbi:MAG: radical SAM protein [Paramuribaculum sp.]|nr:radical SAM protein [Paramuribaculum sp.]